MKRLFKIKNITMLTLTIILVGVLFSAVYMFVSPSQAKADCIPWNIDVSIVYNKNVWHYNLSENAGELSVTEKNDRAVFNGINGKKAKVAELQNRGYTQDQIYCYILPNFKQLLYAMDSTVNTKSVDATVKFTPNSSEKFTYTKHIQGYNVNHERLFSDILSSVGKGQTKITLQTTNSPVVTVDMLKAQTQKRGSFTTTYYNSGADRIHNVCLASKSINGIVLQPEESFSFNNVVGERTAKNGYKTSKIISNGKYVDGIGGGVCQVSTTLYNAVLLSNLPVTKVYQHSLISSYVKPSFDAMVNSDSADLCFVNNTDSPIYIVGSTVNKTITFTIYGTRNSYEIVRESIELSRTPFETHQITDKTKYPDIIYTDQSRQIVGGSDGVKSQAYLCYYQNGKLIKRQKIRENTYKKVDRVVAVGETVRVENNQVTSSEE